MVLPTGYTPLAEVDPATTVAESDTFLLANNSKQVSLANLRLSLFGPNDVLIKPSGDATGVTDHANITAAIAAATSVSPEHYIGSVYLAAGDYYVNAPVVSGDVTDSDVRACSLIGFPYATLEYVGSTAATSYLLSIAGRGSYPVMRLANICLIGNAKVRGLYVKGQTYFDTFENIMVWNTTNVAIDWIDSYGSCARNIAVGYCNGIALRIKNGQGTVFDGLRLNHCGGTTFPSPTESVIFDQLGNPVRTAEANRGLIVVTCADLAIRAMIAELNEATTIPLCAMDQYAKGIRFTDLMYLESNSFSDCYVLIAGANNDDSGSGDYRFENVSKHDDNTCTSFVKTTGYVDSIVIDGIRTHSNEVSGFTNVIRCTGATGHLYRSKVVNARVSVPAATQIVADDGAVLETEPPYGPTFNDFDSSTDVSVAQGAPATVEDGDTVITTANLLTRILTMASSTTGRAPTVPTGTAVNGIIGIGRSLDWSFLNTGNQTVTITAAEGHTLVGGMAIAAGTQKSFRTRCSAANTAVTYALS